MQLPTSAGTMQDTVPLLGALCIGHDYIQNLLMDLINDSKFIAQAGDQHLSSLGK